MAIFLNKVKSLTCTPVGSGGVTNLGNLTNGSFTQERNEIEIPSSATFYPIIIAGGRKDATITVTSTDIDVFADLVLKQFYTDVELEGTGIDCATGAEQTITINMSKAILSEIGEFSVSANGDAVTEYTVSFKAIGDCSGTDAVVTVTVGS